MNLLCESTKSRFIGQYAQDLARELNEFVEDTGLIHSVAPIQIGDHALVTLEIMQQRGTWTCIPRKIYFEDPPPQLEDISYSSDRIYIYKPCQTFDDLHRWSNVQAWLDSTRIISEILAAYQRVQTTANKKTLT